MLGSPILDVAIGMCFVFLTLSFIASAVQEIVASLVQTRAANLVNGIRSLFSGDVDLLRELYAHGIIAGLYKNPTHDFAGQGSSSMTKLRTRLQPFLGIRLIVDADKLGTADPLLLPAYIPPRAFALAMIDILNQHHDADNVMNAILTKLSTTISECEVNQKDSRVYVALRSLAIRAGDDVSMFQTGLEDWYSDAMDRVSGWYKKYTQNVLLVIGLILAIALNVNSIRVAQTLWFNQDARQGLVASANDYLNLHPDAPISPADKSPAAPTAPADTSASQGTGTATAQTTPTTPSQQPAAAQTTPATSPTTPKTKPATPPDFAALNSRLSQTLQTFNDVSAKNMLPVGWRRSASAYWDSVKKSPGDSSMWVLKASLGWILTAIALSLGAPFWFDLLNKFMVVRSTVKPQEKSQTDKTKDNS